MNCLFCQTPMQESAWSNAHQLKFDCVICPHRTRRVKHLNSKNQEPVFEMTCFEYQNYKLVMVLLNNIQPQTPYFLLTDRKSFTILRLNYLPKINPHNVERKLPTILTFL